MTIRNVFTLFSIGLIVISSCSKVCAVTGAKPKSTSFIQWQPWSDDLFARAKAEHKLVLLNLHAVWCHWCHVMENTTYKDPAVIKSLEKNFIAVTVDQDARPDLSARYEDYGWPATVIYNSDGKECEILSGYYSAKEFLPVLQKCVEHPDKTSKETTEEQTKSLADTTNTPPRSSLSESLRKELNKRYQDSYDTKNGGWTIGDKFLPADSAEYCMILAYKGDKLAEKRVKEVLALQKHLLDPAWGGMYQYSTDNDWLHPHYEKIMSVQADNLRIYSLAYLIFHDPDYLQTARSIYGYLGNYLLSPEGAFYTSQDADIKQGSQSHSYFALPDAKRKKLGIPRIDKHIYSRENGWAIDALTYFYMACGDEKCLQLARDSALWTIVHRQQKEADKIFVHDKQSEQLYLSDNLSMGKAFLSLYAVTGDREWLDRAVDLANSIKKVFVTQSGFKTVSSSSSFGDIISVDENVAAVRFFNLLEHYTGNKEMRHSAEIAMSHLAKPNIAQKYNRLVCGILLADKELSSRPFHMTLVGGKADPIAKILFMACQKYPLSYRQTEWYDHREGPLPGQSIDFPESKQATVFICGENTCSNPLFTAEEINKTFLKFASKSD